LTTKYAPAYRGLGLIFAYKGEFKPALKKYVQSKKAGQGQGRRSTSLCWVYALACPFREIKNLVRRCGG